MQQLKRSGIPVNTIQPCGCSCKKHSVQATILSCARVNHTYVKEVRKLRTQVCQRGRVMRMHTNKRLDLLQELRRRGAPRRSKGLFASIVELLKKMNHGRRLCAAHSEKPVHGYVGLGDPGPLGGRHRRYEGARVVVFKLALFLHFTERFPN
ncbi:hypothetical protein L7F22_026506 [Adiantum nelumboides]|nr:hypothetical protein [Adiantum nelumboides]